MMDAMSVVTELELPAFDYTDPELRGAPFHETMAALRERGWLARSPLATFILDREAGSYFLRAKSATFPGKEIAELFEIEKGPLHEEIQRNILHVNGSAHARLRGLVNPAFTPRAVERWRPAMRGFLRKLLDAVPADGSCEFVDAIAKPYPSLTIATVMGAPLSDAPRLHHWSNWIQKQFDPPSLMAERPKIEEAVAEFYEWAGALLEGRRDTPGDDLISTLIEARYEGDRLDDAELVNLVLNVLVGGVDTTQSQLAHAIRLLAEHPDQWALLRSDPERFASPAVEEALRYEPITPFTARIMLEDVDYRDVTFPRGTIVMVSAVTANREGVEGDPDRFDIAADRGNAKPLTFGAGIHYCLGANLARAELQEGLTFLGRELETVELTGPPVFEQPTGIYGLAELPVRFTRAA
jgi:cytochrome P450